MRDIQTVTGYFYAVYTIAAVILSAYAIGMVVAARKAKARLDAASPRIGASQGKQPS